MIHQLCERFGKNFEAVQRALFGVSDDFTSGSIWARATYYASVGGLQVRRSKHAAGVGPRFPNRPVQDGKIVHGKPRRLGIALPATENVAAWLCVLDDIHEASRKSSSSRGTYTDLVSLLERYVCRLTSTGDVERWFGLVSRVELKQRARKLGPQILEASLKLRLQDLGGIRRGKAASFSPHALLVQPETRLTQRGGKIEWPATLYAKECQRIYASLFGTRVCAVRSMEVEDGQVRSDRKRKLSLGPAAGNKSIKAFKEEHSKAVRRAVVARESGKTDGVLGCLLDADMPLMAVLGKQEEEVKGADKDKTETEKKDKKGKK